MSGWQIFGVLYAGFFDIMIAAILCLKIIDLFRNGDLLLSVFWGISLLFFSFWSIYTIRLAWASFSEKADEEKTTLFSSSP